MAAYYKSDEVDVPLLRFSHPHFETHAAFRRFVEETTAERLGELVSGIAEGRFQPTVLDPSDAEYRHLRRVEYRVERVDAERAEIGDRERPALEVAHRVVAVQRPLDDLAALGRSFVESIPALIMPIIIVGGILTGRFTPTEAAVVAAVYALLLGTLYYRSIGLRSIYDVLKETFIDTSVLLFIIGIANLYGYLLVLSGVPGFLTDNVLALTSDPTMILIILAIVLFLLGTFMETLAIIMIMTPMLVPAFITAVTRPCSARNTTACMAEVSAGIIRPVQTPQAKIPPLSTRALSA